MTTRKALAALLVSTIALAAVSVQTSAQYNASRPGTYNGPFTHAPGAGFGFGLLIPLLGTIIVVLLIIAIVLAYLLIKEKAKNKGRVRAK